MKYLIRIPFGLLAVAVAFAVAVTGVCIGGYYYVAPSVPQAADLRDPPIERPLQVLTRDRRLIDEFGERRRTPVDYEDVPPLVVQAILATEDEYFFEHPGIDYRGVLRGLWNELRGGGGSVGGSTITQQIPRTLEMFERAGAQSGVDRFVQKFKEWILAVRIEREFASKEEILELFMNTTFFGQRSYGIATAAYTYFGKTLDELTVSEIAILAGIPQRPSEWNPVYSVENARNRRGYVLRRMLETGAIDRRAHDAAVAEAIVASYHGPRQEVYAPYAAEMARQFAVELVGEERATKDGLKIIMTLDSRLQVAANDATRATLRSYDERHGYKGPLAQVDLAELDGLAPEEVDRRIDEWLASHPRELDMRAALVTSVTPEVAEVRFARDDAAELTATIPLAAVSWAAPYVNDSSVGNRPQTVADVLAAGDIVFFRRDADTDGGWRLAQDIEVEGAFVAVDPQDGAIVALTGGSDYVESKFNRAVMGGRQAGSTFKPLVVSAALENGFTPATIVRDIKLTVEWDPGLEGPWRPDNFANDYRGDVPLRQALVNSLNAASIRILQGIGGQSGPAAGYRRAAEHVRRFGFSESEAPAVGGLVLGVGEVTPARLATAFATFANGGLRVEEYFVDRVETYAGDVVYEHTPRYACGACSEAIAEVAAPTRSSDRPTYAVISGSPATGALTETAGAASQATGAAAAEAVQSAEIVWPEVPPELAPPVAPPLPAERAISAQNAYLVTDMLRDVIQVGSGARASRELRRRDIAGKTGTTNDGKDAWFVGFTDEIAAAAWVGFDLPRSLGGSEQGGRTAIPMWIDFMREALAGVPDVEPPRPPGILETRVNPKTGELASDLNCNAELELFEFGRLPRRESDSLYAYDGACGRSGDDGPPATDGSPVQPPPVRSTDGGPIF